MIRSFIKLFYLVTLLALTLVCLAAFLLYTSPGLHILLQISRVFLPGSISAKNINGSFNNLTLEQVDYQYKDIKLQSEQLKMQWVPHLQHFVITLSPGYYQTTDKTLPKIKFKGGTMNLAFKQNQLKGQGFITIDEHKYLKINLLLPEFALDRVFTSQQKVNTNLNLEINSLDFLHSPDIEKLQGQLIVSIKTSGTFAKLDTISQLNLHKASAYLPKLKLKLDTIDLQAIKQKNAWQAKGILISAGHKLLVQGTGTLKTGELTIEGHDFPLLKTSEYQINVSPALKLHITPEGHNITGTVLIPYAVIKPQSFHNSIALPDEVVYKKPKVQNTSPLPNSAIDINVSMGKNVALDVKGLKGHLAGTFNLKQQVQGTLNAYGELSVKDGTYKAYGQDLTIQQGELIFTGGPVNNPEINLRAAKKINNTPETFSGSTQLFDFNTSNLESINYGDTMTLGVEVTGHLTKPKVQLFSDPAILSQADILSMLVLGRPASQADKASGKLLLAAISSMNVGGNSTQLLEQLKQTAGIDFNVQTNTNYNQLTNTVTDSTAFVVGKSLSKRLYLSYNIGLSQTDVNMLTLRYVLTKFFSIQISSSDTSNAIDFLYSRSKSKH